MCILTLRLRYMCILTINILLFFSNNLFLFQNINLHKKNSNLLEKILAWSRCQLRAGGQGRKCAFSHFLTRSPRTNGPTGKPTDRRTDKASYRVACAQLKINRTKNCVYELPHQFKNRGKEKLINSIPGERMA